MHESHDHTMWSVEEIAILVKMTFLTPVTPSWPLTPNWSCQKCAFTDLLLWPSMSIIGPRVSEILACWQIEEEERRTRSGNRSGHSRLCDFKWPKINIWPHKIARGSQVDQHVWVLRSCYVTWMSHSIFSENDLTLVTPDWHLTHNIGKGSQADEHVWVSWSCY